MKINIIFLLVGFDFKFVQENSDTFFHIFKTKTFYSFFFFFFFFFLKVTIKMITNTMATTIVFRCLNV